MACRCFLPLFFPSSLLVLFFLSGAERAFTFLLPSLLVLLVGVRTTLVFFFPFPILSFFHILFSSTLLPPSPSPDHHDLHHFTRDKKKDIYNLVAQTFFKSENFLVVSL